MQAYTDLTSSRLYPFVFLLQTSTHVVSLLVLIAMCQKVICKKMTRHSTPCNDALLYLYLCRTTDYKMSPSASGVTSRPWTPRCTPPPQQQQPSIPSHPHPHPPPDYHHNVYIPGTPSGFCTLRPTVQRSELDVHNSFSTFGKKRRLQMSPQGEAAIINNDLYND